MYAGVVLSVLMYGAPIWANALRTKGIGGLRLKGIAGRMAVRAARGYRTVAHEAAGVIAGIPPVDLVAWSYAEGYLTRKRLVQEG